MSVCLRKRGNSIIMEYPLWYWLQQHGEVATLQVGTTVIKTSIGEKPEQVRIVSVNPLQVRREDGYIWTITNPSGYIFYKVPG